VEVPKKIKIQKEASQQKVKKRQIGKEDAKLN
jgi:hypothetical protein